MAALGPGRPRSGVGGARAAADLPRRSAPRPAGRRRVGAAVRREHPHAEARDVTQVLRRGRRAWCCGVLGWRTGANPMGSVGGSGAGWGRGRTSAWGCPGRRTRSSAAKALADRGGASSLSQRLRRAPVGQWARRGQSSTLHAASRLAASRGTAGRPPTAPHPPSSVCVSPRARGRASAFLPRDPRAAVRVVQRPRRRRPDSAVRALSGAGGRAPLRLRALPPASPFGGRVTPRRAAPPAPARERCRAGGSLGSRFWALFPPSLASARCRRRGSPRPAPPPRSLRCCSLFVSVSSPGGGGVRSSLCHSGDGSDPPERATRGLRDRPLIRTPSRPRAPAALLGSASAPGAVGRSDAEPRGRPSGLREHRRRRTEPSAGAVSAPCPPRSAGRAALAVGGAAAAAATIVLPTPRGRRSPSASAGKEPFFATARHPHGKVFGLPDSKRFCGEKKKRTKVRLNCRETTSSPAQTVSTGCGNALLVTGLRAFCVKQLENRLV